MTNAEELAQKHASEIRRRAPSLKPDTDLAALVADVLQRFVHDQNAEMYERQHMITSMNLKPGERSEPLGKKYAEVDASRKIAYEALKILGRRRRGPPMAIRRIQSRLRDTASSRGGRCDLAVRLRPTCDEVGRIARALLSCLLGQVAQGRRIIAH
jgi:hypothetical protein